MGFATVYCDKCGAQILGAELEKGTAAARGDKYYCAECTLTLPPPAPGTQPGERKGSTKVRKPGESGRNTDIMRNLQTMGSGRGNTVRVQPVQQEEAGLGTGAKIGLTVVGLAVLALIGFIISSSGGGGKNAAGPGGGKPDTDRARAACESAEALRKSADARAFVEAAQKAKREAAGTEHVDRAAELVREAQAALEAQEKTEAVTADAKRLAADARAAEDPFTYEKAFRDMAARARRDAPALEAQINAWWNDIVQSALLKMLGKVDISWAETAAGFRRVKEALDDVIVKAAAAGPAGKSAGEQAAKKLKEAGEKFQAGADKALAELERKVEVLLADLRIEEAEKAVAAFMADYAGTPAASKAEPLRAKIAARKKEVENTAWIEPAATDWKVEGADGKFTFDGREIRFAHDGPAGPPPETDPDKTRRIILTKADANWKDYELEFEVYIEEHGGTLVVRGGGDNANAHLLNFMPANAQGQGLPKNQWFKLGTKAIGNKLLITVGTGAAQEFQTTSVSGTIMFVGYKGSKFRIRNVRIRRLR
ncbi:MAG: hypothetical protein IT452_04620 [Planctomycetia bacterium]|nr:hypothetical protein [Planctomycetia bacterium]